MIHLIRDKPSEPVLYILCGLSFSGKSRLAAAMAERLGCVVVSLDEINARRGLFGGDGVAAEEWQQTHHTALAEVAKLMRRELPAIVVDDTCCFTFLRDDYRAVAAEHGYGTRLIVLDPPLEVILRRRGDNSRSASRRHITDAVFDAHRASFEWPDRGEEHLRLAGPEPAREWLDAEVRRLGVAERDVE